MEFVCPVDLMWSTRFLSLALEAFFYWMYLLSITIHFLAFDILVACNITYSVEKWNVSLFHNTGMSGKSIKLNYTRFRRDKTEGILLAEDAVIPVNVDGFQNKQAWGESAVKFHMPTWLNVEAVETSWWSTFVGRCYCTHALLIDLIGLCGTQMLNYHHRHQRLQKKVM